ncbi:MAG TPA: hypothetical protein VFX96_16900 [Pyrinomonadaceae bacterium]|nr:hypothetical protein [Pyrinomonadaceae bacterium]
MDSNRENSRASARAPRTVPARRTLAPLRLVARVALRMLVSSLVFLVCAALALSALGYDVPWPSQFEEYFEGVERLADILS